MTDDEARKFGETALKKLRPTGPMAAFFAHALQAIADREALVEAWLTEDEPEAMLAARRHMEGK